jgi:hypothetical protein
MSEREIPSCSARNLNLACKSSTERMGSPMVHVDRGGVQPEKARVIDTSGRCADVGQAVPLRVFAPHLVAPCIGPSIGCSTPSAARAKLADWGEGEGRAKLSINPMQCLNPVISPFFAHLGSMTEVDGAVPWLRR